MPTLDVFEGDAFSAISLTRAVDRIPYTPAFLGELGVFEPEPVRTNTVAVERRNGILAIVPTSERGGPPPSADLDKRDIRDFRTPRLAKRDRLLANSIQNIRAFGSETELMQVQAEVARRLRKLRTDIETTWERHRLGAINGLLLDADNSTIVDWFAQFGLSAPTPINFALGTATTNLRGKCSEVVRAMMKAGRGAFGPGTQIFGLCGDAFWDDLVNHPKVEDTFRATSEASRLRLGVAFGVFEFGGITFVNYRGTDDGTTIAIGTNDCRFFPVGAPGVFQVALSPLESLEFVNTPGQPLYAMTVPDRDRNMFVDIEVYSYPLHMCTRPEMLQRGVRA
jgi:hypothetical protein